MGLTNGFPCPSWAERIKAEELSNWKVPEELEGKVLDSFEELRKIFPLDKVFGEVYLKDYLKEYGCGFNIYMRPYKEGKGLLNVNVAYECPKCDKIIAGPPEIKIEKWNNYNDYKFKLPPIGRSLEIGDRLLYICKNCKTIINEMGSGKVD